MRTGLAKTAPPAGASDGRLGGCLLLVAGPDGKRRFVHKDGTPY